MRTFKRSMRIAAAMIVVIVMASVAAYGPRAGNIVLAQNAIELYRSEQVGWYFFYDAATWAIEEESAEPGSEFVRFSDGEVYVDYLTLDAPGTTPEQCVEEVLAVLSDDPTIIDVEALSDEPGPPTISVDITRDEPLFANTALVVTVDGDDGPFKLATLETCASVGDGQTLVYRSINVPAVAYNEGRQFVKGESPEIVSSVEFAGVLELGFVPVVPEPVLIEDVSGAVPGSLAGILECQALSGPLYIVAEGLRESDFVVNLDAFVAYDPELDETVSAPGRWLAPDPQQADVAALGRGDLGLFQLTVPEEFPYAFDVNYMAQEDQPVYLGSTSLCAGTSAGAPVLIDIE
jgi:hypothetical protein